jgi:hypothetical protein
MNRRSRKNAFTPLSAIKPSVEGSSAFLLHASRRWRRLAGPDLARRLPLLEVREGRWIIGLPSAMWQAELNRLTAQEADAGRPIPQLIGQAILRPLSAAAVARPDDMEPPPAGAGAPRRLRWLMEHMEKKGGA